MADDVFPYDPASVEGQKDLNQAAKGTGTIRSIRSLHEVLSEYSEDNATVLEEDAFVEDDRVRLDVAPAPRLPTTINLFQHPDAHPFVLDLALLRKYGPEWLQWEPEVLEIRILKDFRTKSLSELNADKLHAIKALHLRDEFWQEWHIFAPCALALAGYSPDFEVIQALTVPQAMIAVDVANKLRAGVEWSLEVKTYLSVVHKHDGMFCPLPPLDFVEVDATNYWVNCEDIRARWDAVRASRKAPESTSVENEQLRRMLAVWELLEENRKQLQDQLPLLYHGV